MQLGYAEPPKGKELLPFLRELAADANGPEQGRVLDRQIF